MRLSQETKNKIHQLTEQGIPYKQIAAELGIGETSVVRYKAHPRQRSGKRLTPELKAKIMELRNQGYSYPAIAKELVISHGSIFTTIHSAPPPGGYASDAAAWTAKEPRAQIRERLPLTEPVRIDLPQVDVDIERCLREINQQIQVGLKVTAATASWKAAIEKVLQDKEQLEEQLAEKDKKIKELNAKLSDFVTRVATLQQEFAQH